MIEFPHLSCPKEKYEPVWYASPLEFDEPRQISANFCRPTRNKNNLNLESNEDGSLEPVLPKKRVESTASSVEGV